MKWVTLSCSWSETGILLLVMTEGTLHIRNISLDYAKYLYAELGDPSTVSIINSLAEILAILNIIYTKLKLQQFHKTQYKHIFTMQDWSKWKYKNDTFQAFRHMGVCSSIFLLTNWLSICDVVNITLVTFTFHDFSWYPI